MPNPFNYINKFITGTRHGGPFNDVSKTAPSNRSDYKYWKHDKAYGRLGTKAYFTYNKPDEDLRRSLSWTNRKEFLAKSYFTFKKLALTPGYRYAQKTNRTNKPGRTFVQSSSSGGRNGFGRRRTTIVRRRQKHKRR